MEVSAKALGSVPRTTHTQIPTIHIATGVCSLTVNPAIAFPGMPWFVDCQSYRTKPTLGYCLLPGLALPVSPAWFAGNRLWVFTLTALLLFCVLSPSLSDLYYACSHLTLPCSASWLTRSHHLASSKDVTSPKCLSSCMLVHFRNLFCRELH